MKNLFIIALCVLTFACTRTENTVQSEKSSTTPTKSPASTASSEKSLTTPAKSPVSTAGTAIEENLVSLDSKDKGKPAAEKVQNVKASLDYLTENTKSSREEIADVTNKVVIELQKGGTNISREKFLSTCKEDMMVNGLKEKLGENPEFEALATYVTVELATKGK